MIPSSAPERNNFSLNWDVKHLKEWYISCGLFKETQSHLLQCPQLVSSLKYLDVKPSNLNENLIYGNTNQQEMIVKIFSDILDAREKQNEREWNTFDEN